MKKAFLLIALVALTVVATAQDFSISYRNSTYTEGQTIEFPATDADNEIYFNIDNLTDISDTALLQVDVLEGDGLLIGVCIGQCVPRNIGNPFILPDNGTYEDAGVMFIGNGLSEATVAAKVYFKNRPCDTLTVNIHVTFNAGIGNVAEGCSMNAYPNPCDGQVTVAYTLESEGLLVVNDLLGRQVMSMPLRQGEGSVSLQGLAKGVYTYSIVAEGRSMGAKKLIVR